MAASLAGVSLFKPNHAVDGVLYSGGSPSRMAGMIITLGDLAARLVVKLEEVDKVDALRAEDMITFALVGKRAGCERGCPMGATSRDPAAHQLQCACEGENL